MGGHHRLAGLLAGALALAACDTAVSVVPEPRPERPAEDIAPAEAAPEPEARPTLDAESRELVDYYQTVQDSLQAQGLLRTDRAPADAPFNARQLVENFIRIALYGEYAQQGDTIVARQSASKLHRWDVPVRIQVEFGASVPEAKKVRDRRDIRNYAARLARISGHPIQVVDSGGNFRVYIVNEAERRALGPDLEDALPSLGAPMKNAILNIDRSDYCLVVADDPAEDGTYRAAVALIRGEHPDLFRLSCIHEEIAQGLGLPNDSPAARPSIFNDDEEFGLLTQHDEYLLKMLYDPRMTPGMTEAEARATARVIADEIFGGDS